MAFGDGQLGETKAGINVTPLIDVLLVLLVIFMIVTPLLVKALPTTLPQKSDRPVSERYADSQLVLTVTSDRRYLLNQDEVGLFDAAERIRDAFAVRGGRRIIFVSGADDLSYAEVVRAVDTCLDAGAEKVGIVTGDVRVAAADPD